MFVSCFPELGAREHSECQRPRDGCPRIFAAQRRQSLVPRDRTQRAGRSSPRPGCDGNTQRVRRLECHSRTLHRIRAGRVVSRSGTRPSRSTRPRRAGGVVSDGFPATTHPGDVLKPLLPRCPQQLQGLAADGAEGVRCKHLSACRGRCRRSQSPAAQSPPVTSAPAIQARPAPGFSATRVPVSAPCNGSRPDPTSVDDFAVLEVLTQGLEAAIDYRPDERPNGDVPKTPVPIHRNEGAQVRVGVRMGRCKLGCDLPCRVAQAHRVRAGPHAQIRRVENVPPCGRGQPPRPEVSQRTSWFRSTRHAGQDRRARAPPRSAGARTHRTLRAGTPTCSVTKRTSPRTSRSIA